jgi:acyl dehydratase
MLTRELTSGPRMLPLYLRSVVPLVPGASRLPGVPGGGGEIPKLELTLRDLEVQRDQLVAYAQLCGFPVEGTLPVTYPHVLAFPLQMALMTDGSFPFAAVGLVHVENEIIQRRPLRLEDRLSFAVSATALNAHPRGRIFTIVTRVRVGDELAWEERSIMLRRGQTGGAGSAAERRPTAARERALPGDGVEWHVADDIGRRYGSISGDRNPIHTHTLGAKAFGFPRPIAHGMWTKARCLAALSEQLPAAFTVAVRFGKPVLLPASVSFRTELGEDTIRFSLCGAAREEFHLSGRLQQLVPTSPAER